ncbi:MAG: zinc-ribbon domain-containing protein [Clostridiales bacterium]|nr:zinc-ribbon domain-containing protein [Clostridiales bacterium]
MVCPNCGNSLADNAVMCDACGAEIRSPRTSSGTAARRQGRPDKPRTEHMGSARVHEEAPLMPDAVVTGKRRPRSEGAGKPTERRGTPPPPTTGSEIKRSRRDKPRPVRKMMVNWALLWTVVIVMILIGIGGGLIFLTQSDAGQLIMARMGRDANAKALWSYGQELLDQGYIDRSIAAFEKAYEQEPEIEDLYDRLQQLADAYEAADRDSDAEAIYTKLYTEMEPENPVAYQAIVRMLESQNRKMELSSFLKLAYENTGEVSFRRQREELIPKTPTASLSAGRLMSEKDVELLSAEDYDIYYILDEEGLLPEDGTLYTSAIHLGEGQHTLRAVAVSNDLISDELSLQYTINLPVPMAPYASLAPGEYETRQRIWLRTVIPDEDKTAEDSDKRTDLTIYYTIDGQTPTSNSPIYTGEPFYLPGGKKVIVKAVAVNGYGKVSNVMEREYKINISFKRYFNEADEFTGFSIMETSMDAFVKKYGNPLEETPIEDTLVSGTKMKLTYSWGEARFSMTEAGYVIYYLDTVSTSAVGPRKTKIGMAEKEITEKFRDMGQTYDQNGDRSIYYDEAEGFAKLYHLDDTHDRLDYSYYRTDNGTVKISYHLEKGKVVRMTMSCSYEK